jgi:ABC-type polysaccharide/polyol phosphate transport system ATPase subunit
VDPTDRFGTKTVPSSNAGQRGSSEWKTAATAAAHPLVSVENVSATLGNVSALEAVSVTVESGELLGIIGPNGAGKTTLLRAISNVIRPDSGRVEIAGRSVS